MIDRTTKLRWRRRVRRSRRQVEDISVQAERQLERHFFKRLSKLPGILRFSASWLTLMLLLIGISFVQFRSLDSYYLINKPVAGGIYTEGILGNFTNANPLYATTTVDASVSHLVFAGLLKLNSHNRIVGDLAESWSVNKTEQAYTVRLKDNLKWQDRQPLTADDVVFTYRTIENPDAKSPLAAGLQDVQVTAKDARTVIFTLPNPLSTFPYILTTGIVPKHLLKDAPVSQLRSINFNSQPVGAGPFKWGAIEVSGNTPETRQEQIALEPFADYAGGKPKLGKFIIRSFHDEKTLLKSFEKQELSGVAGLTSLPADVEDNLSTHEYNIPLLSEVLVFFKMSTPTFSDAKIRKALTMATNIPDLISKLNYSVVTADEPILKSQLGYQSKYHQITAHKSLAKKLLASDGWKLGTDGLRHKGGKTLGFSLTTQNSQGYIAVAKELQSQWRAVGVNLNLDIEGYSDLQVKLSTHAYDALLYGVEIGNDPDVFPFWHSSQADVRSQNRLNFSEYKSSTADASLEAGRTRLDPKLRSIKYRPFLSAWRADNPAIALYQPRFLYVTRGLLFGFNPTSLPNSVSRYANVENWMILESKSPR